ncbi:MAG: hypothetical protein WBV95_00290 [Desulfobacterales bacterium]
MKNTTDKDFDDRVFGTGGFSPNSFPVPGLTQIHNFIQQLPIPVVVQGDPKDQSFDDDR